MKRAWILARREWRSGFDSPVSYIFLLAYVIISLLTLRTEFYADNQASLRRLFTDVDRMLLILIPALAMRLWAEESRSGTLELLLTWPVRLWEVVLGKFLAASLLVGLALSLLLPTAVLVSTMGPLDWEATLVGFLGSWLLGMAYLSIACAVSSFTSSQVVAYILSLVTCGLFLIVGEPVVIEFWPTAWVGFFEEVGFGSRFRHFEAGLVRWGDVVYYLSWVLLGLWVTFLSLQNHRRPGR